VATGRPRHTHHCARCTQVRNFRVLTGTPLSCPVASHRRLAHCTRALDLTVPVAPELHANVWPVYLARAVHARLITRRRRVSQPGQAGSVFNSDRRGRSNGDPSLRSSPRASKSFFLYERESEQIFCSDLAVTLNRSQSNPCALRSDRCDALRTEILAVRWRLAQAREAPTLPPLYGKARPRPRPRHGNSQRGKRHFAAPSSVPAHRHGLRAVRGTSIRARLII